MLVSCQTVECVSVYRYVAIVLTVERVRYV